MKYITVEERELFDQLVEKYKIKGYSIPNSLTYRKPFIERLESLKKEEKDRK